MHIYLPKYRVVALYKYYQSLLMIEDNWFRERSFTVLRINQIKSKFCYKIIMDAIHMKKAYIFLCIFFHSEIFVYCGRG